MCASHLLQNSCDDEEVTEKPHHDATVQTIIIDCCMFQYVDMVGVKTLQTIMADYDKVDIRVVFANCKGESCCPVKLSFLNNIFTFHLTRNLKILTFEVTLWKSIKYIITQMKRN